MTSNLPALIQATSGSLGSACANAIAYPLDLTLVRLQTKKRVSQGQLKQSTNGLLEALEVMRHTIRKQGYTGLYAGIASDSSSTLMSNFLYFYAYSYMRGSLQKQVSAAKFTTSSATTLSIPQELGLGFLAGVLSRMVTTPLSVVTVRLQVENNEEKDGAGILHTFRDIYNEHGLAGFWKGFQSTLILSSNPAITLLLFQLYRRIFLHGKYRIQPTPLQAFIGAGLANSIAVALLYPLILLKTRLQSARRFKEDGFSSYTQTLEPRSTFDVAREIVRREGWKGLYEGLEVQLLKGIISQGITFSMKQRIENAFIAGYRRVAANRA